MTTNYSNLHTNFWKHTLLHLITPGGFGYNRSLRHHRDPSFDLEKSRTPVRQRHRGTQGWKSSTEGTLTYRDYTDYEEYVIHQQSKFNEILQSRGGFSGTTIMRWRIRFYNRFKHLPRLLGPDAVILCAGARQGTEVEVLHDLGFAKAYGIDLNPGPSNPLVRKGDFLNIDAADNSIDLLYTNSLDHAFSLDDLFREHARVIKPGGYVLYDIPAYQGDRSAGPFEAVQWQRLDDLKNQMLEYFDDIEIEQSEKKWTWILLRKQPNQA